MPVLKGGIKGDALSDLPDPAKAAVDVVVNVVVAGLGGQGVLKSSDILADAAFRAGHDVKKSEVHGMSQRGGSVNSDVRFGPTVLSPMVPDGEADFLLVISQDQVEVNRSRLKPGGLLIAADSIGSSALKNPRSINVALLGALSPHLTIGEDHWAEAIRASFPPALADVNLEAFAVGRGWGMTRSGTHD